LPILGPVEVERQTPTDLTDALPESVTFPVISAVVAEISACVVPTEGGDPPASDLSFEQLSNNMPIMSRQNNGKKMRFLMGLELIQIKYSFIFLTGI